MRRPSLVESRVPGTPAGRYRRLREARVGVGGGGPALVAGLGPALLGPLRAAHRQPDATTHCGAASAREPEPRAPRRN